MNPIWLLRIKRLITNPPSPAKIKLILAVVTLCLGVWGIEQIWGWPDWLTPQRIRP
jgi:hypothetical protein